MQDTVAQIKERLSILDVITPYVELHKAGKSFKGLSPFTSEKTPSFHVSPDRGVYYCFSSNQGGDMFTFIEKMEGVDFKGALKILADKAGVELVPEDPQKRDQRDRQFALLESAAEFFFSEAQRHEHVKGYISERGVTGKTTHAWRIGYAPDAWRSLKSHLTSLGFTDAEQQAAGLVKDAGAGKEPYDVFRDRVVFPIMDNSGRVIAFSGRTLKKDSETPKYVNSPETELFEKSSVLFGYDKARDGIRKLDFSLIVEGQFDVVLAHQAGYTNTVAVSGTALTSHHVALLERLSSRVVLALDADRAGLAAMQRAASIMLPRGMDVKVAGLAEGRDPADIVRDAGAPALRATIAEARHVIEFFLDVLRREKSDARTLKLAVRAEVVPLLALMPNRIDREHFEGVLATELETTRDAIHYEVERVIEERARETERSRGRDSRTQSRADSGAADEDRAVASSPQTRRQALCAFFLAVIPLLEGSTANRTQTAFEAIMETDVSTLMESADESEISRLTFLLEQELAEMTPRALHERLTDNLVELHRYQVRNKISDIKHEIARVESGESEGDIDALLTELGTLQQALSESAYAVTFAPPS